jgi:hypothetical protein
MLRIESFNKQQMSLTPWRSVSIIEVNATARESLVLCPRFCGRHLTYKAKSQGSISGEVRDLQTPRPAGTHPDTELIGTGGFSSDDKVAGG